MASSSTSADYESNANQSRQLKRKRKMKSDASSASSDTSLWKSESQERIYASKLMDALSQVRPTAASPFAGVRTVRETADRVLAVSAKGKTRWSRAILTGRLSLRLSQINRKHMHKKPKITGDNKLKKPAVQKRLPPFQKKVRVLSKLVPGCRKTSFSNLLEEAIDFISAKQMQVRAMTLLSELLTPGGATTPAANSSLSLF